MGGTEEGGQGEDVPQSWGLSVSVCLKSFPQYSIVSALLTGKDLPHEQEESAWPCVTSMAQSSSDAQGSKPCLQPELLQNYWQGLHPQLLHLQVKGCVISGLQQLRKSPLRLLGSLRCQVSQGDCGCLGGDVESPGSVVGLLSMVNTCMSWQNGPCGLAQLPAEYFGWIRELVWLLWHGNCL